MHRCGGLLLEYACSTPASLIRLHLGFDLLSRRAIRKELSAGRALVFLLWRRGLFPSCSRHHRSGPAADQIRHAAVGFAAVFIGSRLVVLELSSDLVRVSSQLRGLLVRRRSSLN